MNAANDDGVGEVFSITDAGVKNGGGDNVIIWFTFRGVDGLSHDLEFYIQHSDMNIQHTGQLALAYICNAVGLNEINDTSELVGKDYPGSTIAKVRLTIPRHVRLLNPVKTPTTSPTAGAGFQEPPQTDARYVYVISCTDTKENYCKIGIAKSPEKRLKELSTSSPHSLRLEFTRFCGNARRVEVAAHEHFNGCRMNGEWFSLEPYQAISFVNDNIDRASA